MELKSFCSLKRAPKVLLARGLVMLVGLVAVGTMAGVEAAALTKDQSLKAIPPEVHQAIQVQPKAAVALIPGLLNSLVPGSLSIRDWLAHHEPYFSQDIRQTLRSMGYAVYVVKNLSWLGSVYDNANRSEREIRTWYRQNFPKGDVPLFLLGHSSGGLYAMQMAHQNHDLPIRQLILFSAPLAGAKIADRVIDQNIITGTTYWMLKNALPVVDLRGLEEVRSGRVMQWMNSLQIDSKIKFTLVAGGQKFPVNLGSIFNSMYLYPGLWLSGKLIGEYSDGVVEWNSSLGYKGFFSNRIESSHRVQRLNDLDAHLDHFEQCTDPDLLALLGDNNLGFVRKQQVDFYRELLNRASLFSDR